MIGVMLVPVERYSNRRGGLCSENTISIGGGPEEVHMATYSTLHQCSEIRPL